MNNGLDFKQLFDIAPGRFLVLSPDAPRFTILAATDEYLSATKTKREEIVGKGIFEVFPDNPAAPAVKAVGNTRASFLRVIGLRTPDTMGITQQDIPRPDGRFETRFWDVTNFPIFGTEGEVTAIMHRVEDVTRYVQQRKKEAELESATVALKDARRAALNLMEDAMDAKREAEQVSEKLRQEFEEHQRADKEIASLSRFPLENPNPVMRVDAEATLLFANPTSAPILASWRLAIGGRLPADVAAMVTGALKSGRSKQAEVDCDGRIFDFVFAPVAAEGYVNLYARDITTRKKAEESLRITQKSVDTAGEMIAWFTPDGNVKYVNDATCRMLGYTREELLKMPALDITPGFTREQYADLWREVRERKTLTVEVVYRRKNGSEYPAEVLINHVEFGGQEYLFAYGMDITERKNAEEALKASKFKAQAEKRQLEAILKALPVGVVVTDAKGGIVLTNEMDERIWGPRPVTLNTEDYVHYKAWWADSGKEVEPHEWASAQAVLKGKPVLGQVLKIQRFDGRQAYIHNSAFPIRDGTGTIIGSAVAIQDITEVRTADQVLRESEKNTANCLPPWWKASPSMRLSWTKPAGRQTTGSSR